MTHRSANHECSSSSQSRSKRIRTESNHQAKQVPSTQLKVSHRFKYTTYDRIPSKDSEFTYNSWTNILSVYILSISTVRIDDGIANTVIGIYANALRDEQEEEYMWMSEVENQVTTFWLCDLASMVPSIKLIQSKKGKSNSQYYWAPWANVLWNPHQKMIQDLHQSKFVEFKNCCILQSL